MLTEPEEPASVLRDPHLHCAKGGQDRSSNQYHAATETSTLTPLSGDDPLQTFLIEDGEFCRIEECVTRRFPMEPLPMLRDDTARLRVRSALARRVVSWETSPCLQQECSHCQSERDQRLPLPTKSEDPAAAATDGTCDAATSARERAEKMTREETIGNTQTRISQ